MTRDRKKRESHQKQSRKEGGGEKGQGGFQGESDTKTRRMEREREGEKQILEPQGEINKRTAQCCGG